MIAYKQWLHTNNDSIQTMIAYKQWLHTNNDSIQTMIAYKQWLHTNNDSIQTMIAYKQWLHTNNDCIQTMIAYKQWLHTNNDYLAPRPGRPLHPRLVAGDALLHRRVPRVRVRVRVRIRNALLHSRVPDYTYNDYKYRGSQAIRNRNLKKLSLVFLPQ
jgi:hypothetical protein